MSENPGAVPPQDPFEPARGDGPPPGQGAPQGYGPPQGSGPPQGYGPPGYGAPGFGPPPTSPPEWGPRQGGEDVTWAVLVHLSFFVLGIIGPIVVMLTKGKESGWVREHAVEALNFHLTVLIASIVSGLLILVLIGIILLPVVIVGAMVLTVIAAVAASRGERYRYPMNIRMVS